MNDHGSDVADKTFTMSVKMEVVYLTMILQVSASVRLDKETESTFSLLMQL